MADGEGEFGLNSEELCVICATVTIGLERVCATECEKKLQCHVWQGRGRIYFKVSRQNLMTIRELRSVENLFVVVADFKDFDCLGDESVDVILERFYRLSEEVEWRSALAIWKEFTGYHSEISASATTAKPEVKEELLGNHLNTEPDTLQTSEGVKVVPRFRVSCTRTHSAPNKKHVFTSMEAAAKFGGGINDFFGWTVDLENFDLEVLLNIVNSHVVIGISLTKESLFRRNIVHFGPTTLRATLAYCLAVVADIKQGEIVCDPMCGGGSIPLETASNWPGSFNVCGDNFLTAPSRTQDNLTYVNNQRAAENKKHVLVDTFLWDACHLPLKSNSVDVFIADLPFGKKSGSLVKNWQLYPQVLLEMARVCPNRTGRAVLLTKDKKVITKALNQTAQFWKKKYTYCINIGGLQAVVYVLQRTSSLPKQ